MLALASHLISTLVGVALGIYGATHKYSLGDTASTVLAALRGEVLELDAKFETVASIGGKPGKLESTCDGPANDTGVSCVDAVLGSLSGVPVPELVPNEANTVSEAAVCVGRGAIPPAAGGAIWPGHETMTPGQPGAGCWIYGQHEDGEPGATASPDPTG